MKLKFELTGRLIKIGLTDGDDSYQLVLEQEDGERVHISKLSLPVIDVLERSLLPEILGYEAVIEGDCVADEHGIGLIAKYITFGDYLKKPHKG